MFTLNACLESDDYVDKGQKPDNLKQISRKHLSIEDIRQLSPIFEKISDLNQNLYGKNQDESFFVSMNEVLFVTDGTMNSYTFPVIENGQPSNMNILINDDGQNITTSLIEYNLADDELQQIMNGEIIDTTTNAFLYPLNNDQVEITSKDNPGYENPCLIEFRVVDTEPCECHETHAPGGCTHPIRIVELISLDCTGGGGGSDSSGTPPPSGPSSPPVGHTPPGPGSPGGTYGGSSESDGSPGGYTGFVIGDGGTGNQDDVDAINQVTQEMDAAFGVGNWNYDDSVTESNADYIISNFGELNQIQSSIDISEVSSSVISTSEDIILISKVVRLTDSWWGNSIDVSISFNYHKSTNTISNINSDISGNVFAFGWTHHGSGATQIQEDWPDTSEFNESIFEIKVQGFWHYSVFVNGIGTVMKSKYEIKFNADTLGNTFIPSFIKLP